eukprot:TRINITY_DN6977_c0_g1_i1.p1 TRINITY_DN6977_c0_g1~~TRINITY_DN6977_c0_g1_i1.p1  ORF type:complete len:1273 (-),score=515.03 TRINITY_DN6977_c0_g1_i1:141-3881(-)
MSGSSAGAFSVNSTLEKMASRDKDFRYMATADLVTELNKESFKLDADSEKRLTANVLKLLEDSSNQVQELAVKCLGPLARKAKEPQVSDIVDALMNHLLAEKKGSDELRDIASIGLKTVISEIPNDASSAAVVQVITKRLTPRLIVGVSNEAKPDIISYSLEALNDLLGKFGSQMAADHEKILKAIQPQLSAKKAISRKRAIGCLGHLSVTIPEQLFNELLAGLLKLLDESSSNAEKLRTPIQAIGAISKSVGYRLSKFLPSIVPSLLRYAQAQNSDDDLRENCLQCIESLLVRCPAEIAAYLDGIVAVALHFIKHDPNYDDADTMDTDDAGGDESDENEEDGGGEEADYSDDDDMSWKVRRASAKLLSMVINTRPELLQDTVYRKVAPVLISRFKEREENVKLDVFAAMVDVLRQTHNVAKRNPELTSLTEPLRELVPKIVAGVSKQLSSKSQAHSIKVRCAIYGLLRELVSVLKAPLSDHVGALVPGLQHSLAAKNSNSNLKIEALTFLRLLLASHPPAVFNAHLRPLADPVFSAVRDAYYRIAAEALRVCSELVLLMRPEASSTSEQMRPLVRDLFTATLEKLKLQDIDQEVKESAITCTSLLLCNLGDELKSELPGVLSILLDRLNNEITRLTTVKALETIASSRLHLDLSAILADSINLLSSFLRKANRQLKLSSLTTLVVLVHNYGSQKQIPDLFKAVLVELAPLISDADLHLSHLALSLTAEILSADPKSADTITGEILPRALELTKSPLLQGLALESQLQVLGLLVKTGYGYERLLELVIGVAGAHKDTGSKAVLGNVARAVAALSSSASAAQLHATVDRFAATIAKPADEPSRLLALYVVGHIGRSTDLSKHGGLHKTILAAFDSPFEDTRQAASYSLGLVAVGALDKYLPQILAEISSNPKLKYLVLHSLREIIVRQSASASGVGALQAHQAQILPLLFDNCSSDEEGTRNVVAECLGKLAISSPHQLVPALLEHVKSSQASVRATIITALKFAIADKPRDVDTVLQPVMPQFLALIRDSDLTVRRSTLLTLNFAAHNKAALLIRDLLPTLLPLIYGEAKVKPELIREVDLGPFKHKVDDGLDIRKAAYECMYTLVDSCLDRIELSAFIGSLAHALKDQYDIKLLAHLMLSRLASLAGPALVGGLDQLVEPLRETVSSKPKEGAVKQEIERNDELIRSALRAVYAITKIPGSEANMKFEEFLRQTVRSGDLAERFNAVKTELEKTEGASVDSMDLS